MSRLAKVEDLLERALERLRDIVQSDVECACKLQVQEIDGAIAPVPGSCAADELDICTDGLQLVRDIEAEIGRPFEHPEPQWFDDLIDGKWSLS